MHFTIAEKGHVAIIKASSNSLLLYLEVVELWPFRFDHEIKTDVNRRACKRLCFIKTGTAQDCYAERIVRVVFHLDIR